VRPGRRTPVAIRALRRAVMRPEPVGEPINLWICRLRRPLYGAGESPGPSRARDGSGGLNGVYNGKEVDQGIARKAQQEPEGEMEGTETAAEAP
jgi:hypothetical protein